MLKANQSAVKPSVIFILNEGGSQKFPGCHYNFVFPLSNMDIPSLYLCFKILNESSCAFCLAWTVSLYLCIAFCTASCNLKC